MGNITQRAHFVQANTRDQRRLYRKRADARPDARGRGATRHAGDGGTSAGRRPREAGTPAPHPPPPRGRGAPERGPHHRKTSPTLPPVFIWWDSPRPPVPPFFCATATTPTMHAAYHHPFRGRAGEPFASSAARSEHCPAGCRTPPAGGWEISRANARAGASRDASTTASEVPGEMHRTQENAELNREGVRGKTERPPGRLQEKPYVGTSTSVRTCGSPRSCA